jgi:hypothetical protein
MMQIIIGPRDLHAIAAARELNDSRVMIKTNQQPTLAAGSVKVPTGSLSRGMLPEYGRNDVRYRQGLGSLRRYGV